MKRPYVLGANRPCGLCGDIGKWRADADTCGRCREQTDPGRVARYDTPQKRLYNRMYKIRTRLRFAIKRVASYEIELVNATAAWEAAKEKAGD